jgi:hypothetical protein
MRTATSCVAAILVVVTTALNAQWINYATAGIPRTADGKPNLSAPVPQSADGTPDLSGLWTTKPSSAIFYVTSSLKSHEIQPWAEALYQQHVDDFGKDSDLVDHLSPDLHRRSASCRLIPVPPESFLDRFSDRQTSGLSLTRAGQRTHAQGHTNDEVAAIRGRDSPGSSPRCAGGSPRPRSFRECWRPI